MVAGAMSSIGPRGLQRCHGPSGRSNIWVCHFSEGTPFFVVVREISKKNPPFFLGGGGETSNKKAHPFWGPNSRKRHPFFWFGARVVWVGCFLEGCSIEAQDGFSRIWALPLRFEGGDLVMAGVWFWFTCFFVRWAGCGFGLVWFGLVWLVGLLVCLQSKRGLQPDSWVFHKVLTEFGDLFPHFLNCALFPFPQLPAMF